MTAVAELDLDGIEHRMASPMVTYRENVEEDMPLLVAALTEARASIAAVLALHQPVKHISGVTVCSTCFTEDEFPQVYPCRTRVLLGGAA